MTATQAPELVGALGLLERAVAYTRVALNAVTDAALAAPTPCRDWDLTALLVHMRDSLAALREATDSGTVTLSPPRKPADDVLTGLRADACDLLGAWTNAGGTDLIRVAGSPITATLLAATGALEITVHGWDVAVACRYSHPIPATLADELLELVPLLVVDRDRGVRFAPPVQVAATAPPDARLLAALGRDPKGMPR